MYEYRCDERLEAKDERSKRLVYTGFRGGPEHLKIETRLIDERLGDLKIVYYESRKRELKIKPIHATHAFKLEDDKF